MAQVSVANYFNNKKRPITEDTKLNNSRKVLILESEDVLKPAVPAFLESHKGSKDIDDKIQVPQSVVIPTKVRKATPKINKMKVLANQGDIRQLLHKMGKKLSHDSHTAVKPNVEVPTENKVNVQCPTPSTKTNAATLQSTDSVLKPIIASSVSSSSSSQGQKNAMDKINLKGSEPSLAEIKQKLCRSSRLAELRASIARLQQSEKKLEAAQQKTQQTKDALTLKNFKTLELEVNLSPQKCNSPEKPYLSPKKELQGPRKNLFGLSSPVKKGVPSTVKHSLTLPYKYRCLAEVFRCIDTVCQILHNRKETITFKKLKPAVEEMLKRNLTEKHLAQIIHLYPDSFILRREKLREFGTGSRNERWELVIVPQVQSNDEQLTPEILLERRRKFFNVLIEKVKDYHQEFLATLDPPMVIERCKITRWHPLFDIERVPDIEVAELPPQPDEQKFTTGHEVLEKAREMFNCNTRMERALERLQESSKSIALPEPIPQTSLLKGIPQALLEKVRQKQAAKALESMTRSSAKDKEVQIYMRLPEIARLTRNLFVSEKKSVLPLELVINKLCNSYQAFSTKNEMESYLRIIAKEINGWLLFHEIRGDVFIRLSKNSDLSVVMNKLQRLAELKNA